MSRVIESLICKARAALCGARWGRMHEVCHAWMSHGPREWVIWLIRMSLSDVTNECVMYHDLLAMFRFYGCIFPVWRMDETCHVWTSHGTPEWVMSHTNETNESCHVQMSHGARGSVMSRMNESCTVMVTRNPDFWLYVCRVTYEWVMSHVSTSWHTEIRDVTYEWDEWVMPCTNESWRMWMSHVTYEWAMYRDVLRDVQIFGCMYAMLRMHEECHVWTSHGTWKYVMSRKNEWYHVIVSTRVICMTH